MLYNGCCFGVSSCLREYCYLRLNLPYMHTHIEASKNSSFSRLSRRAEPTLLSLWIMGACILLKDLNYCARYERLRSSILLYPRHCFQHTLFNLIVIC
ncbi:hypothetical protein K474DRAFT_190901 [Panus rudis PR-1116 ss-1]|nr:hypothetical protein K474DRAFT_190901 [Panus rudis PR-1116 ss-1]